GEDHPRADALVGETLLEKLRKTFSHTFCRTLTARPAGSPCTSFNWRLVLPAAQADANTARTSCSAPTRKTFSELRASGPRRRPQRPLDPELQHPVDDLLDRKTRRVDHLRIGGRDQGGHRPGGIPRVPLGDLARKGGKASTGPLVFQLLIAPAGALLGAGREVDLEAGAREDDGPHVPAIGHEPRGPGKGPLARQEGGPDRRPGRDP